MKGANLPTIFLAGAMLCGPVSTLAQRVQGNCETVTSIARQSDPVVRQCVVDFLQENPEYCKTVNKYILLKNRSRINIGMNSFLYSGELDGEGIHTTSCTITVISEKGKHTRGPANIQITDVIP